MPQGGGGGVVLPGWEEELAAQCQVYRDATAHIQSLSLKCAVELGVFDTISADGRGSMMTLSDLISKLPCKVPPAKAEFLGRILRLVAQMGYLNISQGAEIAYSLTPLSSMLLKVNLGYFVVGAMDPFGVRSIQSLGGWLRSDQPQCPFEFANGKYVFELMKDNPEYNATFNECCGSDTRLLMKKVVERCGDAFRGVRSLVDVGGNTGAAARAIAEAFPDMKCTVYDLPHVIAAVPPSPLIDAVQGDMFEHIPRADAVFLKHVLHDWSDADCLRILRRCKEAIPADGGKVIVCEIVMPDDNRQGCADLTTQLCWDISVMCAGGKERTEREWKKMFDEAGFAGCKFSPVPVGLRSLIELFPSSES